MEPKIGDVITRKGIKYITQLASGASCSECAFWHSNCWNITCNPLSRKDSKSVIFKKVETNMKEVKIQIPDNCELVRDGDTYIVRKKKQGPPRSWKEFCERYPTKKGEAYINGRGEIISASIDHSSREDKNWCASKEEAEAFLALMQLRQLRKAWVGDWEQPSSRISISAIVYDINSTVVAVETGNYCNNMTLSFPTEEMAKDFLNCFRDLCETAKILS